MVRRFVVVMFVLLFCLAPVCFVQVASLPHYEVNIDCIEVFVTDAGTVVLEPRSTVRLVPGFDGQEFTLQAGRRIPDNTEPQRRFLIILYLQSGCSRKFAFRQEGDNGSTTIGVVRKIRNGDGTC